MVISDHVHDGCEREIRFVFILSDGFRAVGVEVPRRRWPGVSLVSRSRGFRFRGMRGSLLRPVRFMRGIRVDVVVAEVAIHEGVIVPAGCLAWRQVDPARAGLRVRLVRVRDSVRWRASASRRRRRTPAVIVPQRVFAGLAAEWRCRNPSRMSSFVRAIAVRVRRPARYSSGSARPACCLARWSVSEGAG